MTSAKPKFPIIRHVMESGQNFDRIIDKNDEVKCRICGGPIVINERTVHVAEDGIQMVDCPACNNHVSVLYYFDQVNQSREGRSRIRSRKSHKAKARRS